LPKNIGGDGYVVVYKKKKGPDPKYLKADKPTIDRRSES
jgi:hypothetical protein